MSAVIRTPAEFVWEHLFRHVISDATGDINKDLASTFKRNYKHIHTDAKRMMLKLRDIRTGRSTDSVQKWADAMAGYQTIHDLGDRADALDGMDAEAAGLLRIARRRAGKLKAEMSGTRLASAMLAVVRDDAQSLLVANITPANPDAFIFRTCGERHYKDYLRDLYRQPPSGLFSLIEFDKATYRPEDIVLNLSPRQIRSKDGAVDCRALSTALELVGQVEWPKVVELARLADERERCVERIREIDAELAKKSDGLPIDVYDLLDALPPRGTGTWKALVMLASQTTPVEEPAE